MAASVSSRARASSAQEPETSGADTAAVASKLEEIREKTTPELQDVGGTATLDGRRLRPSLPHGIGDLFIEAIELCDGKTLKITVGS